MNDATSPRPVSPAETPPSNLCTECSPESCLEFTVVDYWGEPVTSPTKFDLDGKPVSPDTPIKPLKCGKHILKAVDGEELRQEILNLPYEPVWGVPFPAYLKAQREHMAYQRAPKTSIWEGVPLLTYSPTSSFTKGKCRKVLVEINQGIDYYILMVFLDNHSGGLHGTGHAGVMIINGQTGKGLYTDFGPYGVRRVEDVMLELEEAEVKLLDGSLLLNKNGKLDEIELGLVFHEINDKYGSRMISGNPCRLKPLFNGPRHGNIRNDTSKLEQIKNDTSKLEQIRNEIIVQCFYSDPGFFINGGIAWAAYVLPGGAYKNMKKYIDQEKQYMEKLKEKGKNGYSPSSFNCMTYSLAILDKGLGMERRPGKLGVPDHPNDHIQVHMNAAQDRGIFNDRLYSGELDAVTGKEQSRVLGIRHHQTLDWAFSFEKLYVKS